MQEPGRAASSEPAIDTFPLHRQCHSAGDYVPVHRHQSTPDIWTRCTCLVSKPQVRESEIEYGNTREAFASEAVEVDAGLAMGMPRHSGITSLDGEDTRTGDARREEQICYWGKHECKYQYAEDTVSTPMGGMANPTSNKPRSASACPEKRWEKLQRAGCRGLSAQCDPTRQELSNLESGFTDSQEKPEGRLSSANSPCLQDMCETVGPPHISHSQQGMGQREHLHYRLFVAEPELYRIEPVPATPPSFPAIKIERALHHAGISTHTEFPVDDPEVIQGIKEMGGMEFPVFWLANYRSQDLDKCTNIIFPSGFLFVTVGGALAAWTEEVGGTVLGNSPYGEDVEKAVVEWATEYL